MTRQGSAIYDCRLEAAGSVCTAVEVDPAGAEYQQIANRFAQLGHEFRTRDGYALEAQVGTVLGGLGFPKDNWDRLTEEFSGGWQMRIALAKRALYLIRLQLNFKR